MVPGHPPPWFFEIFILSFFNAVFYTYTIFAPPDFIFEGFILIGWFLHRQIYELKFAYVCMYVMVGSGTPLDFWNFLFWAFLTRFSLHIPFSHLLISFLRVLFWLGDSFPIKSTDQNSRMYTTYALYFTLLKFFFWVYLVCIDFLFFDFFWLACVFSAHIVNFCLIHCAERGLGVIKGKGSRLRAFFPVFVAVLKGPESLSHLGPLYRCVFVARDSSPHGRAVRP